MCCVGIQQSSEDERPCPQVVVSAEEKKEKDGMRGQGAAQDDGLWDSRKVVREGGPPWGGDARSTSRKSSESCRTWRQRSWWRELRGQCGLRASARGKGGLEARAGLTTRLGKLGLR